MSALCDGDFWRVSGEYGVLRAAKIKQNETFLVRRKELQEVAVKQRNLKLCDRRIQSGFCRGRRLKCKLNCRYQRFTDSKRNTVQYSQDQLYSDVMMGYKSFGIGRCKAGRCMKKLCLTRSLRTEY